MNKMKKIGLFGFGTVGQGFYEVLKKAHLPVEVSKVCVRRLDLERINHDLYFTTDANELLEDPSIDIIVEVIDDAVSAKKIIESALYLQKHVISANKKMIADSLEEVDHWHKEFESSFLYEAAVGGGIPIVNLVDGYYRNHEVLGIRGILNGSSNYILTQMQNKKWSYEQAVKEAQKLGFAESNPTLDVSGADASSKLAILAYHAFGEVISMKSFELESIEEVSEDDIRDAVKSGKKIKPVAKIERIDNKFICSVKPQTVNVNDSLFSVDYEDNSIDVETKLSGHHISVGKGAGAIPTGSAVLEDLKRILNGYKYQVTSVLEKVA